MPAVPVKSFAAPNFWKHYHSLPSHVRHLAVKNYGLWLENPWHTSLHFKPFRNDLWSVRVGAHYRAVGRFRGGNNFVWIWIGSHEEYDKF